MQNQNTGEQPAKLIHSFEKSETEQIRIELRKFKGRSYFDIRLWFQSEQSNEFVPTKKGISLGLDQLGELKKGLESLSKFSAKRQPETVEI
ncbi:MAG: transcriptional coactivator p15/PC4 family protein [Candidatus Omnitrophica bacterium]|nr:transcriptional coactivator p15/PC4 family protein [Candidatus Omnitrophota bacterium]